MLLDLATVAVIAWAILRLLRKIRPGASGRARDADWLPPELRDAQLVWSEKVFRCEEPVPLVARIDRAYRERDGSLTLVECKRRAICRVYQSDVVELSVQRFVMLQQGHLVNARGYVVVVSASGGAGIAREVALESRQLVAGRLRRLAAVVARRALPRVKPGKHCQRCGHQQACSASASGDRTRTSSRPPVV